MSNSNSSSPTLNHNQEQWVKDIYAAQESVDTYGHSTLAANQQAIQKGYDAYLLIADSLYNTLSNGIDDFTIYLRSDKLRDVIVTYTPGLSYEACQHTAGNIFLPGFMLAYHPITEVRCSIYYLQNDRTVKYVEGTGWVEREKEMQIIFGSGEDVLKHCTFKHCADENVTIPTPAPGVARIGVPYIGVELECESKEKTRDTTLRSILTDLNGDVTTNKARNFVICKTDGSLNGYRGIEIVTAPATLKFHKQRWKKFFEYKTGACNLVHSFDNTGGRCGMHVHISRDAFTPLSLGIFMKLINDKDNLGFITKVAGRSKSHYTKFIEKKITDGLTKANSGDKYEAVNLRHPKSLEVRIFKGNARKEGFFKNIEFVHAAWQFSGQTGASKYSYNDFLSWIKGHLYEYPYLTAWLIMNSYLEKDILGNNGVHPASYDIMEKTKQYRKRLKSKKAQRADEERMKTKPNNRQKLAAIMQKSEVYKVPAPVAKKTKKTALFAPTAALPSSLASDVIGTFSSW